MEIETKNGRLEVTLPAVLDLPAAGDLRDTLVEALTRDAAAELVLKGADVERITTASLQVILAAAADFKRASHRLEIDAPSQQLSDAFHQLGLEADLAALS